MKGRGYDGDAAQPRRAKASDLKWCRDVDHRANEEMFWKKSAQG